MQLQIIDATDSREEPDSHVCCVGYICMHTGPHTGQPLKAHVV